MDSRVLSLILGGGKGTRLYPLTKERAKPAVPFGGKYRLVDIPISNCINSDFKQIFILTQFNSASLHFHLAHTYRFDSFSKGFVEILAAEQTFEHSGWYEGTADAVRKNFSHFDTIKPEYYMILSGDQLYRMDLKDFLAQHIESGADISLATTPVDRKAACGFGILKVDSKSRVTEFKEKPPIEENIEDYRVPETAHPDKDMMNKGKNYLGSMGIYVFNAGAMEACLDNELTDFGKEIIPEAINSMKVNSYIYTGFWEDIGTIRNFYQTNLELAGINPSFNFYDANMPIYTHRRDLPSSKFNFCTISQSLAADGCIITNASIVNSLIGIRTIIESGASLDGVVCMGADYYESPANRRDNEAKNIPPLGIGRACVIKGAIIDKNARIGDNVRIGAETNSYEEGDHGMFQIRDGIIVIPKNSVIPSGTVI